MSKTAYSVPGACRLVCILLGNVALNVAEHSQVLGAKHRASIAVGLRGSSTSNQQRHSARSAENPLIAEYRREAREYEQVAAKAEASSAEWASKTRAAVYGGGALTVQNTQMELTRRGLAPWARATWAVEKMLRDPSSERAERAAQSAAAPYEQRYRDYLATQTAYNVSSQGFAVRANQDEQLADQLMTYAMQYRLQGDGVSADQYAQRAAMLRRQETSFKDYAAKYRQTADRIQVALPTIQRMAETAARYASWQENPKGAMARKDVFPYTLVPPANLAAPAPAPAGAFQGQSANGFSGQVR